MTMMDLDLNNYSMYIIEYARPSKITMEYYYLFIFGNPQDNSFFITP